MPKYLLLFLGGLILVAAFFILKSDSPINQNANKEGVAATEFSGKISGLQPQTESITSKGAILNIVDPTNTLLISAKEVEDDLSSYQIETSPGLRMAILKVWDFDSKKMYVGSSRIFNVSGGQTQKADIELKEAGTFDDNSTPVSFQPGLLPIFYLLSQSFIAYAADEGPVFAVIKKPRPPYGPFSDQVSDIEFSLVSAGKRVIATDQQSLDQIDEERNLKELPPPNTYGDFTPAEPDFVVEVDIRFHELAEPIVTVSIRNVESGQVFWQDTTDSKIDTRTNFELNNVVDLAANKLVESLSGKGTHPVRLPKFTPSVPKPVKSMAEWRIKLRKLLWLDKQDSATGGAESQTPTPTAASKSACNFDGFIRCRDTFNLQGCIDACPFVSADCPAGTSPDTECKKIDQTCSDGCWDRGTSHGSACAVQNHCTMQEIDARLRAQ